MSQKIIAVGGGKGGVGKTIVSANLALTLALQDESRRIVVADLDFGCGNLNSCLGMKFPEHTINDYLFSRCQSLQETLVPTPLSNLKLISSTSSSAELVNLNLAQRQKLFGALRLLDADWVVLDLGAGASITILDFFTFADWGLVVTSPESLSLHNAYGFLKSSMYRKLWHELGTEGFLHPLRRKILDVVEQNGITSVDQVIGQVKAWDRYGGYIVEGIIREVRWTLVLNMLSHPKEDQFGKNFQTLVQKYLSVSLECLGHIAFDRKVRESIQRLQPFVLSYPRSSAARSFEKISRALWNKIHG